jgi:hypothetical protein
MQGGIIMSNENQDNLRDSLTQEEITVLRKSSPGVAYEAIATNVGRTASLGTGKTRSPKKKRRF